MDYRSALAYLDEHTNLEGSRADRFDAPARPELPNAGQVDGLSLDPMRELMAALGDPQTAFRAVHLTGTNGKGSTGRMIAAIVRQMDLSVGLYTSPNMDKVNERINWDGKDIPDEDFARVMELLASVTPLMPRKLSRFELLTAAAFVYFAEQGVEIGVIEVGLLGRFDATNVVDADVAVITNVGKDHTDGSDGWQAAVAKEKAGIIKPNSHVILGSPMDDLRPIFEAETSTGIWVAGQDFEVESNSIALGGRSIDLRTPGQHYDQLYVPAHGAHQGDNAATAVAAVEAFFDKPTNEDLVNEAWAEIQFPGRFEVVGREPTIILDGAHNPDGAAAAYHTLNEEFARLGSWVLVVGMLSGKDPIEMLEALGARDFDAIVCTEPNWTRAIPAEEIAAAAIILGLSPEIVRKPVEALERARSVTAADDLILVAGSLYVVGEIRSAITYE